MWSNEKLFYFSILLIIYHLALLSDWIYALIDIGSYTTKVVFSDDTDPKSVFPTVVGHVKAKIFWRWSIDRIDVWNI